MAVDLTEGFAPSAVGRARPPAPRFSQTPPAPAAFPRSAGHRLADVFLAADPGFPGV